MQKSKKYYFRARALKALEHYNSQNRIHHLPRHKGFFSGVKERATWREGEDKSTEIVLS